MAQLFSILVLVVVIASLDSSTATDSAGLKNKAQNEKLLAPTAVKVDSQKNVLAPEAVRAETPAKVVTSDVKFESLKPQLTRQARFFPSYGMGYGGLGYPGGLYGGGWGSPFGGFGSSSSSAAAAASSSSGGGGIYG